MSSHHSTTDGPPAAKRSKMEDRGEANDSSYIPTEKDNEPQFSVMFSMKEEKGALVQALELCKVSSFGQTFCPESRRVN